MGVLKQIWLYKIYGSLLLICQNNTMRVNWAWIKRHCVLCSETYNTLHSCHNFPAGSRQASRGTHICETSLLRPQSVCSGKVSWNTSGFHEELFVSMRLCEGIQKLLSHCHFFWKYSKDMSHSLPQGQARYRVSYVKFHGHFEWCHQVHKCHMEIC